MMLATWLVEIYLAKINELEDAAAAERVTEDAENIVVERSIVEEDMRHFLSTYKVIESSTHRIRERVQIASRSYSLTSTHAYIPG